MSSDAARPQYSGKAGVHLFTHAHEVLLERFKLTFLFICSCSEFYEKEELFPKAPVLVSETSACECPKAKQQKKNKLRYLKKYIYTHIRVDKALIHTTK